MEISELQQLKITPMHIAMKYMGDLKKVAVVFKVCVKFYFDLWPSNANLSLSGVSLCA